MIILQRLDYFLLGLINGLWTIPSLDAFFLYWTDVQKTPLFQLVIAPSILGYMIYKRRLFGLFYFLITGLVTAACDFITGDILKNIFKRPRPALTELPFDLNQLSENYGGYSMPSSHAADSFCMAVFIAIQFPKLRWPLLIMATLNAYSRIYIGVHFPSDVVIGAVFGATVAIIIYVIFFKRASRP